MCGIFCILNYACNNDVSFNNSQVKNYMKEALTVCEENIKRRGPNYSSCKEIHFKNGSALLLASVLWLQGLELMKQPVELENIYFLYNGDVFGGILNPQIQLTEGDTKPLLHLLSDSVSIPSTLTQIQGPYALIYFDINKSLLYFGRDIYGRRSLLVGKNQNSIILTSVANKPLNNLIELPSIGIFCINLNSNELDIQLFPWKCKNRNFDLKVRELEKFLNVNIKINQNNFNSGLKEFREPLPNELEIFQYIKNLTVDEALLEITKNSVWLEKLEHLLSLLEKSVEKRIATQPSYCRNCIIDKVKCNHAICGVLFSGGVDCAILAVLCDKYNDPKRPIDLLNVAFEKGNSFETPDRITGKETLKELQKLCPERNWNFLEINVTQEELEKERSNRIAGLIYPLNTILDESLGCAFWFASRGKVDDYVSPCRVLIVGSGADELFGGYTKHRAAMKQNGWEGLHQSLETDWQNISHRNLARDDRVISDHGRQLRTPYLDEDLVEYVRNLNAWERTCPVNYLQQGLGEKLLLRALAHKLGLRNAATFRKRAVQFGSRIANSKENANEVSPRL